MIKGIGLDCRKRKAGAVITARFPENVDGVGASVQRSPKKLLHEIAKSLGCQ